MPLYIYKNKETDETREIFQGMEEEHVYSGEDGEERAEWVRVFTKPNASIQTNLDPHSKESFMKYTENKAGTMGEVFDIAQEASEARIQRHGFDPVKEAGYKKYSAENNGAIHVNQKKEKAKSELLKLGVDIG